MRGNQGLTHPPDSVAMEDENGDTYVGIRWNLTRGEFGRVRAGYLCRNCMEPLERAFPERCPLCGYPVAARQTEDLTRDYQGHEWIGPSPDPEPDERDGWLKTSSGIVVPRAAS